MKVKDIEKNCRIKALNIGDGERVLSGVYCCDLLSAVMGRAFADCAWVTIIANVNSIAVASLAEIGAVIIADGVKPDDMVIQKAKENKINLFVSEKNIFNSALQIYEEIKNDTPCL